MACCAVATGLGFCVPPSGVTASAPSSSPLLRAVFFASRPFSSSSFTFSPLRNLRFPRRHHRFGKLVTQISSSAISSGMGTELHESMVHLQAGLLQRMVDLGFAFPANDGAMSWLAIAVPVVLWYIVAVPGSLSGLVDYVYAPVHALSNMSFDAEEVQVGKQIGQGSFGIVYEGYIGRGVRKGSQEKELHVILKKVKPRIEEALEMHDAEVHMNRRVQRTAPNACADFLGTTKVSSSQTHGRLSEGLWLVWRYEGDKTLAYYMQQKNFPENVALSVLGSKVVGSSKQDIVEQNNAVIREIATQILRSLRDLHKTGLVHRDVKPLNLILAEDSGTFKLVDLGAAVDLRSGYNYVPDETIIDVTYAAPEHHVMPTSTPSLPPDPLCSVVSPLFWLLNTPDRFDLFSAGLVLLQMAVKPLRQDIGLQTFNKEFKRVDYDLDAWRRRCRFSGDEFALLDADDAAGWELLKSMLQPRHDKDFFIWPSLGGSRPSADAALRHRFITGSSVKLPSFKSLQLPRSFVKLPSFKDMEFPLPSFRDLEFPVPSFRDLELPVSLVKLPSLKDLQLPASSVKLPSFKDLELPTFSFPVPPSNLIPNFSLNTLPKFGSIGSGLDMNGRQLMRTMSAVMPVATTSALTLAAGWLIFSAVRDSAQTSYVVGQKAMEALGITGAVGLAYFLLIRVVREAQVTQKRSSNTTDSELWNSQTSSLAGVSTEDMIIDDISTRKLQLIKKRLSSLSGLEEPLKTSHPVHVLEAAAEVEPPINDTTISELPTSRPQTIRLKGTKTGLAEAVQTMELQLASLESSIASGRLFAEQQRQQIIQMEKLLNQRPQEAVAASSEQSSN